MNLVLVKDVWKFNFSYILNNITGKIILLAIFLIFGIHIKKLTFKDSIMNKQNFIKYEFSACLI